MKIRTPFWGSIMIGIIVGIVHFYLGTMAIFVFREEEPLTSWITILFGPLSTLPAVILSIFRRQIGGMWLIIGSVISLIALAIDQPLNIQKIFRFVIIMSGPMALIGSAILFMSKTNNVRQLNE